MKRIIAAHIRRLHTTYHNVTAMVGSRAEAPRYAMQIYAMPLC